MKKILGILLILLLTVSVIQAKSVERIDKLITALITSNAADGDITLDPLGTGKVVVAGDIDISNDVLLTTGGALSWNAADLMTHSEHKMTLSEFTTWDFGAVATMDFNGATNFTSAAAGWVFDGILQIDTITDVGDDATLSFSGTNGIDVENAATVGTLVSDATIVATTNITAGVSGSSEVRPIFSIIADADSDAEDTDETIALTLTPNADPTLAIWAFTTTQSAGIDFNMPITATSLITDGVLQTFGAFTSLGIDDNADATAITIDITTEKVHFSADADVVGDLTAGTITSDAGVSGTTITASTGFALGDGDYVGITGNETLIFNAAGTIEVVGADVDFNGNSIKNAQLELSLSQGLAWDQANDTYERLGSLAGVSTSVSAGDDYLPIQSDMKRCLLQDDGTVNYYIDADDPIMKDGTTVAVSGSATSQPEFFTTEEDRILTGGTSDWTNAAAGDAYASFDKTENLSLTADAIGDYCYITFTNIGTTLESGKRYVLEYDYTQTVAGFEFKLTGVTGQTIGTAVAGTDKKLYFTAVEDYATTDQLQIMATTAANSQGDFDNFSLKCCQLLDAGGDFVTDGVVAGMYIRNITDDPDSYAYIMQVEATKLTLNTDIFPDGTDAYEVGTADFSGTDGQVVVQIDKFYYKQYKTGNIFYWYVSKYDLAGFDLHPAFWKDGQEVDYRYYSAFEGSMYDATAGGMTSKANIPVSIYASGDKMCSVAGQWAKTNETRTEYRAMAAERGTGWRQLDYYLHSAVQLLYLIEYADFNSQVEIGMGRTELSDGVWEADSYIGFTGYSVSDGNGTNSLSNGTTIGYLTDYMTYRGIENFYGNVWKMLDGITWDGRWIDPPGVAAAQPVYVTNNVSYFQDAARVNMQHLCNASYIGTSAGYIGNLENVTGFIPSATGGSETTKVCDYYYQYSESGRDYWRVVLVGAAADYGSRAGVVALAVYNASSKDSVDIGARLCF